MKALMEPATTATAADRSSRAVLTDVHAHARQAVRRDTGAHITIAELRGDTNIMGSTHGLPSSPVYADRHQLARVVASLMDAGTCIFGDSFARLVARYGDPDDSLGSGLPERGAYDLSEWEPER